MIDAIFISDLHLHPERQDIQRYFKTFTHWLKNNQTRAIYILGDFFHVWAGDDAIDSWSGQVLAELKALTYQNIAVYLMPGNRDFLMGNQLARQAQVTLLTEPSLVYCGGEPVLLSHGDSYCTDDKPHQWLRWFTRNALFNACFLALPLHWRRSLTAKARVLSKKNYQRQTKKMAIVTAALIHDMDKYQVKTIIHGHIHRPGYIKHYKNNQAYHQYVLSDWDDNPKLLCYHLSKGFYFIQMT